MRLNERLEKGEKGVNPLDDYCREHDIAYANSGDRTKADCLLAKRAFARLLSETATTNERSVALVTTCCCMISKKTFDKFSLYIKKIIKKNVKKKLKKFKNKINGKNVK